MQSRIQNLFKRNNFSAFVKDKKVALVGPANYLNLFKFGEKINNYDLTARVNRGMELVENNSSKIGSKTDILFNCLIEKRMLMFTLLLLSFAKNVEIKLNRYQR